LIYEIVVLYTERTNLNHRNLPDMIELKNIVKKYGDLVAVDNISLKINKGEIVGLLGPNGAGKSTTMKILTGFLYPNSGNVIIDGVNMKEDSILAKSKIGYMPENNPLYKEMLVADLIEYALDIHNFDQSRYEERINYVVKATGIQNVFYRPVAELSKGYRQRVGLAQTLVHDPEILILDEPTEGLDPNQRREIRELIKKLGKDRTVIISTHVMQEVEAMCNRIIIINKGEIIKDGSKDEILSGAAGGNAVNLRIKGRKSKIKKSDFSSLNLENISIVEDDEGIAQVHLVSKDAKIFENISEMLKRNDWIVYHIEKQQEGLEQIFSELTQ
jgi:ABC-2 type transport system ATP-binding protein